MWPASPMKMVLATVMVLPTGMVWAQAEQLIDRKTYDTAEEKAGDMRFEMSLAQTAAYLDYCKVQDHADELRGYIKGIILMGARVELEKTKGSESELRAMRGMYISRMMAAAIATEAATAGALKQLEPLDKTTKKKLCAFANEGYEQYRELRARAKAVTQP